MIVAARRLACAALWITALSASTGGALTACGKPEDDGVSVNTVSTPLPPYPVWAAPMIGRPLASVVQGKADCKGVFDDISVKHVGKPPGSEVEGWAWDATAKQGVQRILIVDLDDHIVGAAVGGRPRLDVPPAMPGVTSKFVGWHGVVGATTGTVLAVGLGAHGGQCSLSKSVKLGSGAY